MASTEQPAASEAPATDAAPETTTTTTTSTGTSTPAPSTTTATPASDATTETTSTTPSDPSTSKPTTTPSEPAAAADPAAAPAAAPKKKKKVAGKNYSTDPALYIYTSLTAGNMHIVTATSRLETILRANRVPFKATDLATDEKARMLWGRRAGKTHEGKPRRLPALVQMGMVLGDLSEIEEWNEYGELKQHVKIYYDEFTQPAKGSIAPVPKYTQPENREAHPPAALNPPPPAPPLPNPAQVHAATIANSIKQAHAAGGAAAGLKKPQQQQQHPPEKQAARNVAEEAAERANAKAREARQARIDALREKVASAQAARGEDSDKGDVDKAEAALAQLSISTTGGAAGAGLQSPTTGAWRETGADGLDGAVQAAAATTVQSPTSSSWKAQGETSLAETVAGTPAASAGAEGETAEADKAKEAAA